MDTVGDESFVYSQIHKPHYSLALLFFFFFFFVNLPVLWVNRMEAENRLDRAAKFARAYLCLCGSSEPFRSGGRLRSNLLHFWDHMASDLLVVDPVNHNLIVMRTDKKPIILHNENEKQ